MQFVYDSICKLYALELYEDVTALLELSSSELASLSQIQAANVNSIAADSYFQCDNFTKSQEVSHRFSSFANLHYGNVTSVRMFLCIRLSCGFNSEVIEECCMS